MDTFVEFSKPIFTEYGLAGCVIGGLFSILFYMLRQASDERKEWRKLQQETNEVIRGLTAVVERLR